MKYNEVKVWDNGGVHPTVKMSSWSDSKVLSMWKEKDREQRGLRNLQIF